MIIRVIFDDSRSFDTGHHIAHCNCVVGKFIIAMADIFISLRATSF